VLADAAARLGKGAEISVNVHNAVKRGLEVLHPGAALLITGSIFVVASAREDWARHCGGPLRENDH